MGSTVAVMITILEQAEMICADVAFWLFCYLSITIET